MRGSLESDPEAEDADEVDESGTDDDPVAAEAVEELEEELEEEKAPVKPAAPPRVRRLDIVSRRNWFFLLSLVIIIPGILSMSTRHFLLGIDFAGGTEFTVRFPSNPPIAQVESAVSAENIGGSVISTGGNGYIIRTLPLSTTQLTTVQTDLRSRLGTMEVQQVQVVGGTIGAEPIEFALLAVTL